MLGSHGAALAFGAGGPSKDLASALDDAVNGVFLLTAKMSLFYGAWTYVTHVLFGASTIFIPVLAAAFLAAVPFFGNTVITKYVSHFYN